MQPAIPTDQIIEDLGFLWLSREALSVGPNGRLINLVRQDERLQAFLQLLRVHRRNCLTEIGSDGLAGVPAADFLATSLSLIGDDEPLLGVPRSDADSEPRAGAVISALCWAPSGRASEAIQALSQAPAPQARAIAIGALGARRTDPGAVLASALTDPSSLVRSRAARTTGQLGRRDLVPQLLAARDDPDPECRFWAAWAAARMGADAPLETLAEIAWNNTARAGRALDLLLRRLDAPRANAWLRDLAAQPNRQRDLIRATGIVGDPLYIPWLLDQMTEPSTTRLAGEAFSMITGLDLAYRDLDCKPPADFQSGPNDDPEDENVALDEDENLPWPDPAKIGHWWVANRARFSAGTAYFLGAPKQAADWLEALSDAFQRQRHAAALELAIRQPDKAMFEVRARGRLQRQMIARARGLA
ncbi:MAG: TIGR02270 family protein [Rhodospirillales bacterium]|nr:TIGR02270 family protein [Rhodospirillales bacterium]